MMKEFFRNFKKQRIHPGQLCVAEQKFYDLGEKIKNYELKITNYEIRIMN